MNTQNQRQKTGRRGGILENKLVTACTVSSSRALICSNLRGFVFCFNRRGYSRPAASTGPAGKTALPAKRRSQALCSPTLPLGTDTDIQLPRLADRPLSHLVPLALAPCSSCKLLIGISLPIETLPQRRETYWPLSRSQYLWVHSTLSELKKSNSGTAKAQVLDLAC